MIVPGPTIASRSERRPVSDWATSCCPDALTEESRRCFGSRDGFLFTPIPFPKKVDRVWCPDC
jgi:hypothetical protein